MNRIYCDGCGHTETIPDLEVQQNLSADDIPHFMQSEFLRLKQAYGNRGWYTSVGQDLCPACCKQTGTQPGYDESDVLPDVRILPRNP